MIMIIPATIITIILLNKEFIIIKNLFCVTGFTIHIARNLNAMIFEFAPFDSRIDK